MIAYSDFEFAIERWKARTAGVPQPVAPATSGAVADPMPVSTAPEQAEASADAAYGDPGDGGQPTGEVYPPEPPPDENP